MSVSGWSRAELHASSACCIDLFCGAGGMSLGFLQAGGQPLVAVDSDVGSVNTYETMFGGVPKVYKRDLSDFPVDALPGGVEFVIGGPPCQGFSLARGTRFVDDPRNRLYREFVRVVDWVRPRYFVMENVPGITSIGSGAVLEQIYEDFGRLGYYVEHRIINMALFGVPQTRRRAIFVGTCDAQAIPWPMQTHMPKRHGRTGDEQELAGMRSVRDALSDLPWPLAKWFAHRANSQMRGPRNRRAAEDPAFTLRVRGDEFAFCAEPALGAFAPGDLPDVRNTYAEPVNEFQMLMREQPPPWVASASRWPTTRMRPSKPLTSGTRRLAIREQARLQTFPDWFVFSGSRSAQSRQIGNAVPPMFARQLFSALIT